MSFSFYLLFPTDKSYDLLKLSLSLIILFFPSLFKSFLQVQIENLVNQIRVAELFGLSRVRIVFSIVLRQIRPALVLWFSFLSIYFLCDFGASKALGLQTRTLGLITLDFLSSYRLSFAYLISFYIIFLWFFLVVGFYYLIGVLSVIDKKFISATR